jgi:enamine deaminase RidA (YjgF/YER057c/UK114 family)
MGYCRAVVVGEHVHVAGTAPIPRDGSPVPEGSYEQTLLCLDLVREALERAGTSLENVVRTRCFITDQAHFEGMARAHGETFRDVRPVNTTVVTSLMDPAWTVEIEVEAVLP